MNRNWKTYDLVDLFESIKKGYIPLSTNQFTNQSIRGDGEGFKIYQHDINWPTHMEPDFDKFKPGQFIIEDNVPIPPRQRDTNYQWEDALLTLPVGKCLTIRLDGTTKEANNLMTTIRNRLKKINPELLKCYISRSIKGEGKWKGTVVAIRIWRIEPDDEQ